MVSTTRSDRLNSVLLLALHEVFPVRCARGTAMRIVAFMTYLTSVRDILVHLGKPTTSHLGSRPPVARRPGEPAGYLVCSPPLQFLHQSHQCNVYWPDTDAVIDEASAWRYI